MVNEITLEQDIDEVLGLVRTPEGEILYDEAQVVGATPEPEDEEESEGSDRTDDEDEL